MASQVTKAHAEWVTADCYTVCITFTAGWLWDDFYIAQKAANLMIRTQGHFVDIIYYFPQGQRQPLPTGYYRHLLNIARTYPENLGMALWTNCHPITIAMIRDLSRNHHEIAERYAFIDSIAEARLLAGP